MRTTAPTARHPQPVTWQPWHEDLLTVLGRGGIVETEPAPWLAPRQTKRVEALVDDLHVYQALSSAAPGTVDAARARRRQAREIAARLTELLKFGIRVRWHTDGDTSVRLLCQRCRR